jgi:hypothetical protein
MRVMEGEWGEGKERERERPWTFQGTAWWQWPSEEWRLKGGRPTAPPPSCKTTAAEAMMNMESMRAGRGGN